MGFRYVASGPLVRSSYRAGEFFTEAMIKADRGAGQQQGQQQQQQQQQAAAAGQVLQVGGMAIPVPDV